MQKIFLITILWITPIIFLGQSVNYTFEQGQKKTELKQYDEALSDFQFVVKKDPYYYEAYFEMGKIYLKKKDTKSALKAFHDAIIANSNYTDAYIAHLNLSVSEKKYSEALNDLKNLIRLKPNEIKYYEQRAHIYSTLSKPKNALQDLNKAIDLGTQNTKTYLARAELYKTQKKDDLYLNDLKKALTITPSDYSILNTLGNYYFIHDNIKDASSYLQKAVNINPNADKRCLQELATCLIKQKKYKTALPFLTKLTTKHKDRSSETWLNKGLCERETGNLSAAKSSFGKAIIYDHKNVRAYVERALLYEQLGKTQSGKIDFTKAIAINPKSALPYFHRGRYYLEKGKYQSALEDLNKAIKNQKNAPAEYYYWRAICYYNLKKDTKACQDMTKASDMGYKQATEDKDKVCR